MLVPVLGRVGQRAGSVERARRQESSHPALLGSELLQLGWELRLQGL